MARKIFLAENDFASILEKTRDVLTKLSKSRVNSKNISVTVPVGNDARASLQFTQKAWIKMTSLVVFNQKEVGWHGTVMRVNETTFLVKDIVVFPQEVTGATVVPDQEAYTNWLDSLDDETFNTIRFHGHSHVNMGVTPSAVDTTYRNDLLNNFKNSTGEGTWFYIFMIMNKRGEFNVEIYDMENNALYDEKDVDIDVIMDNDEPLSLFFEESKTLVKEHTYQAPAKTPNYSAYQGTAYAEYWKNQQKAKAKEKEKMPDSALDDLITPPRYGHHFDDEWFE